MIPRIPTTHDIILVGGGHSHVAVLKRFGMKPEPGVRLTLITRDLLTPYSGMIPGYIAGHYSEAEAHIDLRPLAAFANARVIHAAATGLDLANNCVKVAGRPPVAFDLVSIDTGSTPLTTQIEGAENGLPVKPIDRFLKAYHRLKNEIQGHDGPFYITIAGGGAGGVELALALSHRLELAAPYLGKSPRDFRFTIVEGAVNLLPDYNAAARQKLVRVLRERRITVRTGTNVSRVYPGTVTLADGSDLVSDKTILVTSAGPPDWLADSDVARDGLGFVKVDATLRSPSHPQLFASGDAAAMDGQALPKAGVYAVREGPYLAENLIRAARGQKLKTYRPQGQTLALITTGNRFAIAARGPFSLHGAWVWHWKDWIDRRWMKKYQEFPKMDGTGTNDDKTLEAMRCGGCAAKVPAPVLRRALERLPHQKTAGLDQGLDSPDDAAILTPPPGKALIQTIDQFRAFIDDPYLFGRITTNHCLGDIFAMGGEAHSALAAVMLPHGADTKTSEDLYQLLAGATETLAEAGAVLAGGHTGEGAEMAFGLTVNGYADPNKILRKGGLSPGDALILTKPLGVGILFAADMRAKALGNHVTQAFASMQRSLAPSIRVAQAHGASAATDVTGFGLAGHLLEMLNASGVDAKLILDALPVLPGVTTLMANGYESTLRPGNEKSVGNAAPLSTHPNFPLLFDPQTAGGLLFGVPTAAASRCLTELRNGPAPEAVLIGRIIPRTAAVGMLSYADG